MICYASQLIYNLKMKKQTSKEFSFLEMSAENDEQWYRRFQELDSGPITQCLILIVILKKENLISQHEGNSFKSLVLANEQKARQAIQNFTLQRSIHGFRT